MKLHGCNVLVRKDRNERYEYYVIEIGEEDNLDRFTAFEVRKQILETQKIVERLNEYKNDIDSMLRVPYALPDQDITIPMLTDIQQSLEKILTKEGDC